MQGEGRKIFVLGLETEKSDMKQLTEILVLLVSDILMVQITSVQNSLLWLHISSQHLVK